jgi:hypothetical protein
MKWVLVLIVLQGVNPDSEQGGVYNSILDCFAAREKFMDTHEGVRPAQAICIRTAKA